MDHLLGPEQGRHTENLGIASLSRKLCNTAILLRTTCTLLCYIFVNE